MNSERECTIKLGPIKRLDTPTFKMPVMDPARAIAEQLECELLLFADRFKTRRVYFVQWTEDKNFSLINHYKMFTHDNRAEAYHFARFYRTNVKIYDFKKIIDLTDKANVLTSCISVKRNACAIIAFINSPSRFKGSYNEKTFKALQNVSPSFVSEIGAKKRNGKTIRMYTCENL